MAEFKDRIFTLRNEKHFTQEQLARELNVSKSTIAMWENGERKPSPEKFEYIADYFNVDTDYLYGRSNIKRKIHYDEYGEEYVNSLVVKEETIKYGEMENNDSKYYLNDETSEIAQEIFENKELRLLFDAAKDAQPEDLQTVHQMLLALKRKERGDIDWLPSSFNQFSYWKNKRSRHGKWGRELHNIYWREVI